MHLNLIQTHLNYNPLIQRGKNGSEDMTNMMKSKYKAMQAFGLRGDPGKHRKNSTTPFFDFKDAIEFEFKWSQTWMKQKITTWILI